MLAMRRFERGDLVIIVAGAPPGTIGSTNLIHIHRIGENDHSEREHVHSSATSDFEELLAILQLTARGRRLHGATSPQNPVRTFGGQLMAQAFTAASRTLASRPAAQCLVGAFHRRRRSHPGKSVPRRATARRAPVANRRVDAMQNGTLLATALGTGPATVSNTTSPSRMSLSPTVFRRSTTLLVGWRDGGAAPRQRDAPHRVGATPTTRPG